jgi:hypothetical protein
VNPSVDPPARSTGNGNRTRCMTPDLVRRTEAAFGSVGAFGAVRLIVEVVHSESLDRYPDAQEPSK